MSEMTDREGLTATSLLLIAIVEAGDPIDMKRAAMAVSDFPQDLAGKYWETSQKIARLFADDEPKGELQ